MNTGEISLKGNDMTQITYLGYCALGGAANPNLMSRAEYLGKHYMHTTYWIF